MVAGLGVCLSNLVVSQPSGTASAPLPSISGLNKPTVVTTSSHRLAWWQILLMALGCAFIFVVIIWLFRRRQRKQRAKRTAQFAMDSAKKRRTGWRWKLIRFGEKLFGRARSPRVPIVHPGPSRQEREDFKLTQLRMAEEARRPASFAASGEDGGDADLVKLIASYNRPYSPETSRYHNNHHDQIPLADQRSLSDASSMYSQMTGLPRKVPDPRQPLKSRFSMSTFATNELQQKSHSGKKAFWK